LDAATVDGGNRRQVFRYITLPLIMPWLALLTIRDTIMSFQNTFTPAYLMTGGDPYYATLFMPLLTYEEAFGGLRLGLGSALMLLTTLITALLIGVVYLLFRGRGHAGD
jgi:multiple sugar transport system permease protein